MFEFADLMAQAKSGILQGYRAPLLTGFVALLVSWFATPWMRTLAFKYGAVDDPKQDDRRIHKEPLARWGGIAIYLGILFSLLIVLPFAFPTTEPFPRYLIGILLVGGGLVAFGAMDDLKQFSARKQLIALLGAGLVVQLFTGSIGRVQIGSLVIPLSSPPTYLILGWAAFPITAIYIFIVTKTMDTIDGVDGLASGIATITAATLTVVAAYGEQPRVAIIAASIAGASLGFLRHNYNPAKIIMGTGGAYILGFTLACLSIVGALKTAAAVSILIPVLAFGVPIFDAFFVIFRRWRNGVPITTADKRHVHHTLLGHGLSQRQTVWVLYTVTALLCAALLIIVKFYA